MALKTPDELFAELKSLQEKSAQSRVVIDGIEKEKDVLDVYRSRIEFILRKLREASTWSTDPPTVTQS